MRKVLLIGWKDVVLSFRDRAALILMLVAPFVLTLGLGFVTGRFSGQSASGVSDIPVVVVDEDGETLGSELVEILKSQELEDLLAPSVEVDRQAAERKVDEDKAAVAIVIPKGFTQSVVSGGETVQIVLYTNPTRPTSSGVVQAIMDGFFSQLEAARVGGEVTVEQLLTSGRIQAAEAPAVAARIAEQMTKATASESIQVRGEIRGSESVQFDALAYMAPGMALMFLMFTVTNGGRTLIAERVLGTLPRLLVSPTSAAQILGGKVLGIYLTGVTQVLVLIGASTLLFRLHWGQPLAVLALVLACVAGAVGWGMLITAVGRTAGQVSAIGSAIMLTFGVMGGSFFSLQNLPGWFRVVSKITPNAWGMDGFLSLARGDGLAQIALPVTALCLMGVVLFGIAAFLLQRRGIAHG